MRKKLVFLFTLPFLFFACSNQQNITIQSYSDIKKNYNFKEEQNLTTLNQTSYSGINFDKLDRYLKKRTGVDCSGFVFLVNKEYDNLFFKSNEISNFYDKTGRRSKAIYNMFKSQAKIRQTEPRVGDLAFFANTTRKTLKSNKDKENITHVAIVTKVFNKHSFEIIHNLNGIVKKGYIDLNNKNKHKINGEIVNSYIITCKKGRKECLASQRFSGFAKVGI